MVERSRETSGFWIQNNNLTRVYKSRNARYLFEFLTVFKTAETISMIKIYDSRALKCNLKSVHLFLRSQTKTCHFFVIDPVAFYVTVKS